MRGKSFCFVFPPAFFYTDDEDEKMSEKKTFFFYFFIRVVKLQFPLLKENFIFRGRLFFNDKICDLLFIER